MARMRRAPAMPLRTCEKHMVALLLGLRNSAISPTKAISSLNSMRPARSSMIPCRSASAVATPKASNAAFSASIRPWRTSRSRNTPAARWKRCRSQASRTVALTTSMPVITSSATAASRPYRVRCSASAGDTRRMWSRTAAVNARP